MDEKAEGTGLFCASCDSEFGESEDHHESVEGYICEGCSDQFHECANCYISHYPEQGEIVDGDFVCKGCLDSFIDY